MPDLKVYQVFRAFAETSAQKAILAVKDHKAFPDLWVLRVFLVL